MSPFPSTRGPFSSFPSQELSIVHNAGGPDERRTPATAHVQAKAAYFDVTVPVYEGDVLEMDDPRGGVRRLHVTDVRINDVRGSSATAGMSHTKVTFSERAPDTATPAYEGPVVVNIKGDHAQVAWGKSVSQTSSHSETVAAGYEGLAAAVTEALELLGTTGGVHPDDRAIAQEDGQKVLEQLTASEPDTSVVRRGLATLTRGFHGRAAAEPVS